MAQDHNVYSKIVGGTFQPMGLPVDTVWPMNDVVQRFVVENGYAVVTDADGVEPVVTVATPPNP